MLILSYVFVMALLSISVMGQDYDEIDGVAEKRSNLYHYSNEQRICFVLTCINLIINFNMHFFFKNKD